MSADIIDATAEALPLELLNATNKELTAQLSRCEQLCDAKAKETEDQRKRLDFMKAHLGNVRGEIVNTQSLVECKRREVESETHMCRLLERECGRLKQTQSQMKAQLAETQEQQQALQNRIFHENLRVAELKGALGFNQEELQQWEAARKLKEADELAVARYSKSDETKMRQLETALERLEARLRDQRRQLEDEVMVTRGVQQELDRAAEDYRRRHEERRELLEEWTQVVKAIHERDAAISTAATQYAEGAAWVEERQALLKQLVTDLDAARDEEASVRAAIKQREQHAERARGMLASLKEYVESFDGEVETLREQLARTLRDNKNSRIRVEQSKADVERKRAEYERALVKKERVKEQKCKICDVTTDLAEQRANIAQMLQEARSTHRQLDKEVENMERVVFAESERLHVALQTQDELLSEISGGQAQVRNLNAKIGQLDRESFAQQEVMYNAEFNVQQMQRKVSRAKGERTEEERSRLNEKISLLQQTLNDLTRQQTALATQVKRVQEEAQQGRVELAKLRSEEKSARDQQLMLKLECDSCSNELRGLCKEKEDELVLVDTHELQLQGLKRLLYERSGELRGLEEQKRQLSTDVSVRLAEIAVHHDLLKMEAKLAEEERRRLVTEVQSRQKSLDGLRHRYDVRMGAMDPEQAHWTQAQLVIEAAKEREALQCKGDALDSRVARMERELTKLERTLQVIRASNANFRHMFDRVAGADEVMRTKDALQERQKELKAVLSRRTMEANEYEQLLHSKKSEKRQILEQKERVESVVQELQQACTQAHESVLHIRETIIRYEHAIARVRSSLTPEVVADVELQERRQVLEAAVSCVRQVAQQHGEEAMNIVSTLLDE